MRQAWIYYSKAARSDQHRVVRENDPDNYGYIHGAGDIEHGDVWGRRRDECGLCYACGKMR